MTTKITMTGVESDSPSNSKAAFFGRLKTYRDPQCEVLLVHILQAMLRDHSMQYMIHDNHEEGGSETYV